MSRLSRRCPAPQPAPAFLASPGRAEWSQLGVHPFALVSPTLRLEPTTSYDHPYTPFIPSSLTKHMAGVLVFGFTFGITAAHNYIESSRSPVLLPPSSLFSDPSESTLDSSKQLTERSLQLAYEEWAVREKSLALKLQWSKIGTIERARIKAAHREAQIITARIKEAVVWSQEQGLKKMNVIHLVGFRKSR